MTAAAIAQNLRGRKSGAGWSACCPAHKDRTPSLSLRDVDGKVLVHCHAGCEQTAVVEALKAKGLWPENIEVKPVITQTYDYVDETGKLLYQICRIEPKGFLQRRPDGYGGWVWKKHPRQVLYHLPEVLEAPIVFIAEGEKDVETLRAYGFVATTNAGGAKAPWLAEFSEALRDREVIIIPDNDQPGWNRAAIIARSLLGVAARIRVFDLPPETKDITDWFQVGHSECELIAALEGVDAI
jgi:putative DNA primase/helicase